MIQASDFIGPAKALGFTRWAGVPCSFLTPFINSVIDDPDMSYLSAANEGDAVAAASGAALAGNRAVAMMQNSGLGNAVSPLSSLNWVFRIPILLIVTLRGEPGLQDEPQHELMGQITGRILDELQIPWDWFPRDAESVEGALMVANWHMDRSGLPYAFIMKKGSVDKTELKSHWQPGSQPAPFGEDAFRAGEPELTRQQALTALVEQTPEEETVVVGTTGYTGRELFAIADRPNQLYMVGSMGCASSFGLGLSLALPGKRIVVADGDGAALMRMGNLATAGAYGGKNFHHLVLDNGVHESTGGQSTVSRAISFAGVARACGYRQAEEGLGAADLQRFLHNDHGPSLLQLKTKRGVPEGLPRPDVTPRQVKQRLMQHLGIDVPWMSV
ncbi:MAG: phosphonopyruvate decarboxylase [Xanthomonadales bacterium]|jgi:phosphonopyruvate decarboxylase|nr:phosphonopyruvate decarboxylase [Xanthomonadales bacterium]